MQQHFYTVLENKQMRERRHVSSLPYIDAVISPTPPFLQLAYFHVLNTLQLTF